MYARSPSKRAANTPSPGASPPRWPSLARRPPCSSRVKTWFWLWPRSSMGSHQRPERLVVVATRRITVLLVEREAVLHHAGDPARAHVAGVPRGGDVEGM